MANDQEPGKRKRFEALLQDANKTISRKKLKTGEKAIPEVPLTFRAGFRFALQTVGLISESTTELSDDQLDIMISQMENILEITPPLPDHQ